LGYHGPSQYETEFNRVIDIGISSPQSIDVAPEDRALQGICAPVFFLLAGAVIVFHNLLDPITPAALGRLSGLWMVLHTPGLVSITPQMKFFVGYPLIPWIGVTAAGYAMGMLLQRHDRRKWTLGLGVALTLAFFVLRTLNLYGNGDADISSFVSSSVGPWKLQPTRSLDRHRRAF
jgi:hypothetical protein